MASSSVQLSVIVPRKNPGERLRDALASIWAQVDVSLEVIVIDGGSTDGSREWLETERRRIAVLISEPDRGIYDAMNKGIAAAHGDWLLFLGADDRLVGTTVLSQALTLAGAAAADVVAGEAVYTDGRIYRLGPRINPIARNFVHHQAALYRRTRFAEQGTFDRSLPILADYDFNLRLWQSHVPFKAIPLRIAACGTAGMSDNGAWRVYREEITVRHRHFPAWRCLVWDALSVVRFLRKQVVRRFNRKRV